MTSDDLPHQVLYASDLDTLEYGSGFPRPPKGDPAAATMSASAVTGAASIGAAYAEPLAASDAVAGAKSPGAKQLAKAKAEAKAKAKVEMLEREREAKELERTQALPIARRFATAGWNLNNLCRLDRCVLAHCNDLVSGMVVPWLYVGMLFSSFCWHVEDHYAHSINYMHWGSPKTWYGVPGSQAEAFERVMRDAVPELVASEQGLLYKMVTMVPPLEAAAAGVDVCHLLQQPGTFVITWPRGYHAGFSHGLNCAESSNFATADWLPWGRQSVESFRTMPGVRRPCFTHELLLSTLARKALVLSAHIAQWVAPELDLLIETEAAALEALSRMGVPSVSWSHTAEASDSVGMTPIDTVAPMDYAMDEDSVATAAAPSADAPAPVGKALGSEAPTEVADVGPAAQCPMCVACEYECFLSTVECRAADGTITYLCPAHALAPPSHASPEAHAALALTTALPASSKRLIVYRPLRWLRALLATVAKRAAAASAWVQHARHLLLLGPLATEGGEHGAGSVEAMAGQGTAPAHAPWARLADAHACLAAGTALQMDDEHMLRLGAVVSAGAAVQVRAAALQAGVGRSKRAALPTLEQCASCLEEAAGLPLVFEALGALVPVVQAGRAWEARARAALDMHAAAAAVSQPPADSGAISGTVLSVAAMAAAEFEAVLTQAAAIPLSLPLRLEVEAALTAVRVEQRCAQMLLTQPKSAQDGAQDGATPANAPPSAEALRALVSEAATLAAPLTAWAHVALATLTEREASVHRWLNEVSSVLRRTAPLLLIEGLSVRAATLSAFVTLPAASLAALEERSMAGRAWLAAAEPLAGALSAGRALTSTELGEARRLLDTARASPKVLGRVVEVDEATRGPMAAAVLKLDTWLDRCAAVFVKHGCEVPLLELLSVSPATATITAGFWPPTDDENLLCCPCCTPERLDVPSEVTWISCDECGAWFHSYCVRVPDVAVETLDSFRCPRCCSMHQQSYVFAPTLPPPILRTMRPAVQAAEALRRAAADDGVAAPEVEALQALLDAAAVWKSQLHDELQALAPAQPPPPSSSPDGLPLLPSLFQPPSATDLPTDTLVQLLGAAAPIELTMPEAQQLACVAARRAK